MRDLTIAYGNNHRAKKWVNKTTKYTDLKERLKVTIRTTESAEEYAKMSKAQRDAAKDHGGFVGGVLAGGRRKVDTVESRSMIVLDGDRINTAFLDNYERNAPYTSFLYTTHSHTADNPRVRLIFPLTRDITAEEFVAVSRYLAQMLGIDYFDECSYQPNQLMYCPSSPQNGVFVYKEVEKDYEVQVEHYTAYIKNNPEWELVEVYADDGISATNTAKREAFNRMIQDCRDGKIDLILTKSISRFSRNTVDCLKYTRELKGLNIAVFFEKENINTLDAKGEVLMTIMAALAQQESESLSANVRLGIQFRNQQGKVQVNHNRFLGYTKDEDGKLIIVPEEAGIVRRIYAEYMDGRSFLQIKRSLEADGILNGAGNAKWHESNIKQILTNEKYIGDALLQKTYTVNTLEKKRVANNGLAPKYYVEGSHEAIIDKDIFLRVQAEIVRRANILTDGKKRVYSSRYALSSIVFCGHCGDIFRRVKWNNRGCKSTVWRCVSRVLKKSSGIDCPARTIHEEVLQAAVVTAVNDAWSRKDAILPELRENIRSVLEEDTDAKLAEIDEEVKQKQTELLDAGKDQSKIDEIGDVIMTLREKR